MEPKILSPLAATKDLMEYLVDAGQRTVLYLDVMRRRGNQHREHMAKAVPHVLHFTGELILDGRTFPRPVNYGIVKIKPPAGTVIDDRKRPFVVIDPRAGHGPGIGGFKADSEIGDALRAGHPCYFIGFTPYPEKGQTIEAVIDAWAVFLERVAELHADAEGKPAVIGNCQAGWALMMLAAKRPTLCGPLILAGSPLSYWGGVRGVNPMRYTGGLLGGSWLTTLTSDLGAGKFDGAWLVQNFENLNPANTLWTKQYNVYSKVDTEGFRYLEFEQYWGGHTILAGQEIQYIVDELFIGNKLSTAQMVTADGVRLDFRKIRSPILCFCSKGDNITPPQQALGWILDLYQSDEDILAAGQTIVYSVHPSIGHLGIFVSTSVAKKEHQEFAGNIDLIDCMPPGLYEAILEQKTPDTAGGDLVTGQYISRFARRGLADIRALGGNTPGEERCFKAVARLSETTHGLYRTTLQPVVRALANEQGAEWMRRMHPLRVGTDIYSDINPVMKPLAAAAEKVRENRRPVAPDNLFLQWEKAYSEWIVASLNAYRDWRDMLMEQMFFGIYQQPWLQALLGVRSADPAVRRPGRDVDHETFVEQRVSELRAKMDKGGPREAAIRAMIYIRMPEDAADERAFETLRRFRAEQNGRKSLDDFKQDVREQYLMLRLDESRAVEGIPSLLKDSKKEATKKFLDIVRKVVFAGGPLHDDGKRRLARIEEIFTAGERTDDATEQRRLSR